MTIDAWHLLNVKDANEDVKVAEREHNNLESGFRFRIDYSDHSYCIGYIIYALSLEYGYRL